MTDECQFAKQLWCVSCLAEVGGADDTLYSYIESVIRYSAGILSCPHCGKRSEPMTNLNYVKALAVPIRKAHDAEWL